MVDVPAATWPTLKTVSVTENVPPTARTGEVGVMADGTVVIEGVINLWVTEKRADLKAATTG